METSRPARTTGDMLDAAAVCASTLCMVHCLLLPLLLTALPALADRFGSGESVHAIVLAFAVPTSAIALIGGWRVHRAAVPVMAGTAGLMLMIGGIAFARNEAIETALTVTGSLFLAAAHIVNWRHRSRAMSPVDRVADHPTARLIAHARQLIDM